MGRDQREAIIVAGITPPHYKRKDRRWELVLCDQETLSSFAKKLGAQLRARTDFAWITTTFDVASGKRTSSNPEKPDAGEALPDQSWERVHAMFRVPDPSDYRIIVPGLPKGGTVDLQMSPTGGKQGDGILDGIPISWGKAQPPTIYHFPGIRKIEELREKNLAGRPTSPPLTLDEYLGFFYDKDGYFSPTKWLERREPGPWTRGGVATYFPEEHDPPTRMVSMKAVLDYAIGGQDRRRCPIGEIHFITVTDASGPVLLGTPDVILLAPQFKPFAVLRATMMRSMLDLDGRTPIDAKGYESRASDFASINMNVRDLRAAFTDKSIIAFWNGKTIPALEAEAWIHGFVRDAYVSAFRQSFASAFASLPFDGIKRTPIRSDALRAPKPLSVITRCLGIQGSGTDLVADSAQERKIVRLCEREAPDLIKLDNGAGLSFALPSSGVGYGRMVGPPSPSRDLLAYRYPISASDIDRLRDLKDDTEVRKELSAIISALRTVRDDAQLLRSLAYLDTVRLLNLLVKYLATTDPNGRLHRLSMTAQNTLVLFVRGDFTFDTEPHNKDPKLRWRSAKGFSTFQELVETARTFAAKRGALGALGIIGHGGARGTLVSRQGETQVKLLDRETLMTSSADLKQLIAPGGDVVVLGCTFGGTRAGTSVMKSMARLWPDCWIIGFSVLTLHEGTGLPEFFCTNSEEEAYAQVDNPNQAKPKDNPILPPRTAELRKKWRSVPADEFSPYAKIVWYNNVLAKEPQVVHWPMLPVETMALRQGDWFERPELDDFADRKL